MLSEREARRLIYNAFVRAFRKEAGSLTDRKHWQQYIRQFRGNSQYDYGYISEHLREDYGFGYLAEDTEKNIDLTNRIDKFLISRLCRYSNCQPHELDSKTVGKSRRDSRLVIAVHNERQSAHTTGEPRTYCIVSSARLVKETDDTFRREFGEPEMVVSISALGFLLTLTPQVQMSFGTLRSILFDTYLATRLTPIQRFAYRAIAATGQWSLPWSRRVTLQRELRHTILEHAKSRGIRADDLKDSVLRGDDAEFSAQVVAETLDKMAITPKTQQEIRSLQAKIKQLQEEEVEEKKQKRTAISIRPKDLKRFRGRKKK